MSKVIIVNGIAGCGKTTFEGYCKEFLGEKQCYVISTIDFVKKLAKECGWDGEKTPEARKFLSDFKDLLSASPWGDITYNKVVEAMTDILYKYKQFDINTDKVYFFVDAREPEQIKLFKDKLDATTVLVRNERAESIEASNHADANVLNYEYDYTINNNGTLEDLKERARVFCQILKW